MKRNNPYITPMFTDLYNTDILALTAMLKNERLESPDGTARKVSKLCGSWLEIDVMIKDDKVADVALRVQACALGQASAAILKENIIGASFEEIKAARHALYAMLKEGGDPDTLFSDGSRFEKLKLLSGVKAYPARHTSTMLAVDAAVEVFNMISTR